jgi:anti-sigma regulatory factor (Ser/Thr protein kinase)
MVDAHRTHNLEESVARVTVLADEELLPVVVEFVRRTAHQLGLRDKAAKHLEKAVETVCRNAIDCAFEPGEEGRYDVHVLRRPGQVAIAIEDQGMPFDYACFQNGNDTILTEMLHRSFANEIRFVNLGRGGNRVELVKYLSHADVREQLSEDEHHQVLRAPVAPKVTLLEVRMMRPEEAFELSRCVYCSYGYSYDWEDIYYPERIQELQQSGLMHSCVAVTQEGEFVGHLALMLEHPDSLVGEAGQAVVDPRFRGHHLFEKMKTFLVKHAKERGIYGLYSEATAVHPYSQKGNLHLGAKETGYLLGYIPASVSYKEIGEAREGRRGSVALFYMKANAEPARVIYPPPAYQEIIGRIIEHNGLRRTVENTSSPKMPSSSRVSANVRHDHNLAFLRVEAPGADLREVVRVRLRELCLHRVDCVYVDLPLCYPATGQAGAWLMKLGFFLGGIIPEAHSGAIRGDVLRMQYLNNVEINPEDVQAASDFGRELLDLIFRQKDTVQRWRPT